MTDNELVSAIAHGDRAAFGEFYDRHSTVAYRLILRISREAHAAEDILQDAFLQVWSRAAQFDPARGTPLAWLVLIARSRALDHARKRARTTPAPAPQAQEQAGEDASVGPQHQEIASRAGDAMKKLPPEQKQAIQWAFFDGLSHSEIANQLDLPLGTVKTRIRSGMTKLRDALGAGTD